MVFRGADLQRFLYSHYFFGGVRQAIGVLSPALILGGLFQWYSVGAVASFGAACVAILDQAGGPRRYGSNGMLGAIVLGTLTTAVTGLASGHPLGLWLLVPLLCFVFSMFTVFGKQGGLLGFACLLLMTLTMRTPMAAHEVLLHTFVSLSGGLFYFLFSTSLRRLLWHREGLQALSAALFATADYMRVRSQFYDENISLDDSYRELVHRQADMTEKHQAARDVLLRDMPGDKARGDHLRIASLNVLTDMVSLLDTMIATQTDYATLRRELPGSDVLLFSRDALFTMSRNLEHMALDVARNRPSSQRDSVKAELRALEYELEKYRRAGLTQSHPEVYGLLVQILRRLRNASRILDRLGQHTRPAANVALLDERLNKSSSRYLSRQHFRLRLFTSNLRLDSPHFRYAVRVTIAAFIAMSLSALLGHSGVLHYVLPGFSSHSYWIILTLLVIMKPGYALTQHRNKQRLTGTLIGCVLALALFKVTDNVDVYIGALIVASVLGYSWIQLSQLVASVFNTLFVLLVFHFLSGGDVSTIGERFFDTVVASIIALGCSYILPWWEHNFMASLAKAAWRANQEFFTAALRYASLTRALEAAAGDHDNKETQEQLAKQQREAEMAWQLAQQQAYTAFSNYAAAFYRMMDEPVRQQVNVPEFNRMLIQNHILASQITAATPVLSTLATVPPGIEGSLEAVAAYLNGEEASPPTSIETEGELATLAYPVRQMVRAAQSLREEMHTLMPTMLPAPSAA